LLTLSLSLSLPLSLSSVLQAGIARRLAPLFDRVLVERIVHEAVSPENEKKEGERVMEASARSTSLFSISLLH
jgi:hypothetical protein